MLKSNNFSHNNPYETSDDEDENPLAAKSGEIDAEGADDGSQQHLKRNDDEVVKSNPDYTENSDIENDLCEAGDDKELPGASPRQMYAKTPSDVDESRTVTNDDEAPKSRVRSMEIIDVDKMEEEVLPDDIDSENSSDDDFSFDLGEPRVFGDHDKDDMSETGIGR